MKKIISSLIIILSLAGYSQVSNTIPEKSIKPLRIGVKVGIPNILTLNGEYVTPLWDNRVAVAIDYFGFNKDFDDTNIKYSNFEIGSNVYFNSKGKGLYGGLSYFSFNSEGTYTDVEFDDQTAGSGKGNIDFNTVNLKLGIKAGRTIYFRLEVGYGFGKIPETIVVRSSNGSGESVEEIPDIPGIGSSGIPVFNLGFGIGFF